MKLNPEDIARLAKMTVEAKPAYVDCESWLHMVGEYVEASQRGDDVSDERSMIVRQHAEDCPKCMEELEHLRELLADNEG